MVAPKEAHLAWVSRFLLHRTQDPSQTAPTKCNPIPPVQCHPHSASPRPWAQTAHHKKAGAYRRYESARGHQQEDRAMPAQTRDQGALGRYKQMGQQRHTRAIWVSTASQKTQSQQYHNGVAIRRQWRGRTAVNHCQIWMPWPRS